MSMRVILLLMVISLAGISSCGGPFSYNDDVPTNSPPNISRVDPASGAAGSEATLFGFGFSYIPANNFITMGAWGTLATQYNLLPNPTNDEIESLNFTVPAELTPGDYAIVLVVDGNASNADVVFTVTGS